MHDKRMNVFHCQNHKWEKTNAFNYMPASLSFLLPHLYEM